MVCLKYMVGLFLIHILFAILGVAGHLPVLCIGLKMEAMVDIS